jgi:hypothetical protein
MMFCGFLARIGVVLVVAVVATGAGAVQAVAGTGCAHYALGNPFLPWLDPLSYERVPNGGFEKGSTGWTLTGGAKVVSGNEKFSVGGAGDGFSLSLPAGSSATSSRVCVYTLDAVMRFFAINTGSLLSTLKVEVIYTDVSGTSRTLPVGVVLGTGTWAPTLPTLILANLLAPPLLTDGEISVAIRLAPVGSLGGWRVDDVYVDPLKGT